MQPLGHMVSARAASLHGNEAGSGMALQRHRVRGVALQGARRYR
jgi:hypothetical protein